MSKRKTHEEFIQQLFLINKNIEIIGKYIGAHEKILCKCLIHNIEWDSSTPNSLLKGTLCPICRKENQINRQNYTHEQFISKIKLINNNIIFNSEYINSKENIECECKIDGYKWDTTPNILLQGHGCPKCSGVLHKTHEEFVKELYNVNKNIMVIGKYITARIKILCKCLIDGCQWEGKPNDILNGHGCPKCVNKYRRSHDEFIEDLYVVNPDIEVIDIFKNTKTKVLCKCKIDNYEWPGLPEALLKGIGCPLCSSSKGEKEIVKFFKLININYIQYKTYEGLVGLGNGLLSYDFYLSQYNLLIEYQGEQHEQYIPWFHESYDDFLKQLEHDRRKREYAKKHNVKLLEIWYYDFDRIEEILQKEL